MLGTIPTQIEDLKSIRKLSISYNQIKGTIPSNVKSLETLSLFHVHGNQITGNADLFQNDHNLESFISDCGNTDLEESLVDCTTCTQCCNEEGSCITLAKTWPDAFLLSLYVDHGLGAAYTILLVMLGCCMFLLLVAFVMSFAKDKLPLMKYPIEEFQQNSIYRFYLGNNKFGKSSNMQTLLCD